MKLDLTTTTSNFIMTSTSPKPHTHAQTHVQTHVQGDLQLQLQQPGFFIVADIIWVRVKVADPIALEWLTRWKGYSAEHDTLQSTESLLYCTVWRQYCDAIGFPWKRTLEQYERSTTPESRPVGFQVLKARTRRLEMLCIAAAAVEQGCEGTTFSLRAGPRTRSAYRG